MEKRPLPSALTNIDTVARLEQKFLDDRTLVERAGDAIGGFIGSMGFIVLHVLWFGAWILVNVRLVPWIAPFDPYPFLFLSMFVSLEGVLLTTFVLMKQNRMSKRADHRDQLNLQIDLLAEKEVTKILQMLRVMCDHMGLEAQAKEPEAEELSQKTAVDELSRELRRKMPD